MSRSWPELPAITESNGQPRLPRDPAVVAATFHTAVKGARTGGIQLPTLLERIRTTHGEDLARLAGLAGWMPVSGVARWSEDGHLHLHPATDAIDLALRYTAWISAQPTDDALSTPVAHYHNEVVRVVYEMGPGPDAPPEEDASAWFVSPQQSLTDSTQGDADCLVPSSLTRRVRTLLEALDAAFLERRAHVRAALLALLGGQHVLLLGPPGTAKSMLARALCQCFQDAEYFEYLLSRFTHPDELFGPVSIPGLKQEDYRRLTDGFLPQAHVAFLDEIFKANSAILNSLLTLINERVFHHGQHRDPVPLLGIIGASNELPDPEGGLEALYDRFLIRLSVPPLSQPSSFVRVATGTIPTPVLPEAARLTPKDLQQIQAAGQQVEVPAQIAELITSLWRRANQSDWGVSDRRWRAAVTVLKVGAALDGRRSLAPLDATLLVPMLAPEPEQIPQVREVILEHLRPAQLPQHDLRSQWVLLGADRVAPTPSQPRPLWPALHPPARWDERLRSRQQNVARFLELHEAAVLRVASARTQLEDLGEQHLWLDALPIEMLTPHIEASRDLAAILRVAESYRRKLVDVSSLTQGLIAQLPREELVVPSNMDCTIGIGTDTGWCIGVPIRSDWSRVASPYYGPTTLRLEPEALLAWLSGEVPTENLLVGYSGWDKRKIRGHLDVLLKILGPKLIPVPGELPR